MLVAGVALGLAATGAGGLSVDHALGIDLEGWPAFAAVGAGAIVATGGFLLLARKSGPAAAKLFEANVDSGTEPDVRTVAAPDGWLVEGVEVIVPGIEASADRGTRGWL